MEHEYCSIVIMMSKGKDFASVTTYSVCGGLIVFQSTNLLNELMQKAQIESLRV